MYAMQTTRSGRVSNDKAAATYHPDESAPTTQIEPADDDLPPVSVLGEWLKDVVAELEELETLVIAHRRACGDDHHQIGRFQDAQARIGQALTAAGAARKYLRAP
jgi:hypothetical protein